MSYIMAKDNSLIRNLFQKQSPEGVLLNDNHKKFAKFTRKHLCQSLFFIKLQGSACSIIKKDTLAQMFSCRFSEIFKNIFKNFLITLLLLFFSSRPRVIYFFHCMFHFYLFSPVSALIITSFLEMRRFLYFPRNTQMFFLKIRRNGNISTFDTIQN